MPALVQPAVPADQAGHCSVNDWAKYRDALEYALYSIFAGLLECRFLTPQQAATILRHEQLKTVVKTGDWKSFITRVARSVDADGMPLLGSGYDVFTLEDVEGNPLPLAGMCDCMDWLAVQKDALSSLELDGHNIPQAAAPEDGDPVN